MSEYNTYIQQIKYDGKSYSKGSMVGIKDKFNIVCQNFPFKKNPKTKDLPMRDWPDEDGADVYVPATLPMKHYDIDVVFLCKGTNGSIRADVSNFINFICGRSKGADGDSVQSGRLAIYNEYVGMGRKDVVVSDIDDEIFDISDNDPDNVAKFKVKFTVYDPVTEVSVFTDPETNVTELKF